MFNRNVCDAIMKILLTPKDVRSSLDIAKRLDIDHDIVVRNILFLHQKGYLDALRKPDDSYLIYPISGTQCYPFI